MEEEEKEELKAKIKAITIITQDNLGKYTSVENTSHFLYFVNWRNKQIYKHMHLNTSKKLKGTILHFANIY